MMLHRRFFGVTACAALAPAPVASGADLAADWSGTLNPNGVWQYGEYVGGVPSGWQIHTNPLILTATVEAWDQGTANSSYVSKNVGASTVFLGTTFWAPTTIALRPGVGGASAVARFVAQIPGNYSYSVSMSPGDTAGGTRDVNVYVNGVLANTSPMNGAAPGPVVTFISPVAGVPLAVGGTIDFVVGDGGTPGDFNQDSVMFRNTVVNFIQTGPVPIKPCRWIQPWTKPWASHISAVQDCAGNEVSWAPVAMDDFICDKNTKLKRLTWWGTNPTQNGVPQKQFHIRIWEDNQQCFPQVLVYQACVQPKIKLVSIDCQQRRVFRFATQLTPPFLATGGQRYWLQISEIDFDPVALIPSSPNPQQPDFAWSSHRKIKGCRALQRNTLTGFFQQPLFDPCDGEPEDLAFTLSSRCLIGVITPVPISPTVFTLKFFDASGNIMEECPVLPDDRGAFVCESDLPDGCYEVQIYGMATVGGKSRTPVCLVDGAITDLGTIVLPTGDADNSLQVNFADITRVVGEWLRRFDVF